MKPSQYAVAAVAAARTLAACKSSAGLISSDILLCEMVEYIIRAV
jgi:hypothetical protein